MDVKVRDALTDDVVNCYEAAFRLHGVLYLAGEHLGVDEKWTDEVSREIEQRWIVGFGNEQDVAGEKRAHVEKGHGDLVFENYFGFDFACNDFAEQTGFVSGPVSPLRHDMGARFLHADKINLTELVAYRKFTVWKMRGLNLIHGVNWFGDFARAEARNHGSANRYDQTERENEHADKRYQFQER
jgi:hypothetical protein